MLFLPFLDEHLILQLLRVLTTPTFIGPEQLVSMCQSCHRRQTFAGNFDSASGAVSQSCLIPRSTASHLKLFLALMRFDNLQLGLCGLHAWSASRVPASAMCRKSYFFSCLYAMPLSTSYIPRCLSQAQSGRFGALLLGS